VHVNHQEPHRQQKKTLPPGVGNLVVQPLGGSPAKGALGPPHATAYSFAAHCL
jgi:hypothetical protein